MEEGVRLDGWLIPGQHEGSLRSPPRKFAEGGFHPPGGGEEHTCPFRSSFSLGERLRRGECLRRVGLTPS